MDRNQASRGGTGMGFVGVGGGGGVVREKEQKHININLLVWLRLGMLPGLSQGQRPVCPWDKPGLVPGTIYQRRKIHPKKSTQNIKKVHLNKFVWTIFVGFLSTSWHASQGRRQKFARTLRKSSGKNALSFWVFRDFGWPWTGKSCFSNRALVEAVFEAPKCLQKNVLEASKLVSTKTLLLKHYYRRQGVGFFVPGTNPSLFSLHMCYTMEACLVQGQSQFFMEAAAFPAVHL